MGKAADKSAQKDIPTTRAGQKRSIDKDNVEPSEELQREKRSKKSNDINAIIEHSEDVHREKRSKNSNDINAILDNPKEVQTTDNDNIEASKDGDVVEGSKSISTIKKRLKKFVFHPFINVFSMFSFAFFSYSIIMCINTIILL